MFPIVPYKVILGYLPEQKTSYHVIGLNSQSRFNYCHWQIENEMERI